MLKPVHMPFIAEINRSVPPFYAVVVAAGKGDRLGLDQPKALCAVGGKTLAEWSLLPFLQHPQCAEIILVIDPAHRQEWLNLALPARVRLVDGGNSRQESVRRGLMAIVAADNPWVLIHDAARANLGANNLDNLLAAITPAATGAYLARPILDSLHRHHATQSVPVARDNLWAAETPQAFRLNALRDAHQYHANEQFTDDVALARAAGIISQPVASSGDNFKITLPADLQKFQQVKTARSPRIGQGFDIHVLVPSNGSIRLGGIDIPCPLRAAGHSDADVVLHALCDALYGACGAGDIGQHFPPSDGQWRGADSAVFLKHALHCVRQAGGEIVNIDFTILAELPKIAPHRDAIRTRIAHLCNLPAERINIKATTMEGLGAIGQRQGIAAMAQTMVLLP